MMPVPGSRDVSSVKNESRQVGNKGLISLRGTKTINVLTGFDFIWPRGTSSVLITNLILQKIKL